GNPLPSTVLPAHCGRQPGPPAELVDGAGFAVVGSEDHRAGALARRQQSSDKLDKQARDSLAAGREDLAREALVRKSGIQSQMNDLQTQYASLQSEEEKLT